MFFDFHVRDQTMIVRVRSLTPHSRGGGVEDMAKSLARQPFGKPSHRVLELDETSDQVARLSEAGYAYKTKRRELEHQFDVKASQLREDYIAEVLEIHTADGPILDGRFAACKKARVG
jgi:hypothetical protein